MNAIPRQLLEKCTTREWKEIPLDLLTPRQLSALKKDLTFPNPSYHKTIKQGFQPKPGTPESIEVFWEDRDTLYIPRYFRALPQNKEYLDRPVDWPGTDWNYRSDQLEAAITLRRHTDGLLVMGCGRGKSIIMLLHLQWLNQKALVIAPSRTIINQWKGYFENVFQEKEAKLISSKSWKAGECLSCATLQLIALSDLDPEFYNQFGVVIYDEVDTANAMQFSKALAKFRCHRYGLTATKHREDGMDILTDLHIGPTLLVDIQVENTLKPLIYFRRTNIVINQRAYSLIREITRAAEDEKKFARAAKTVLKSVDKGRSIFILCERVSQAEMYYERLKELGVKSISLAHAEIKEKDRDYSKQVIVGTNLLARGFNKESLDTLLIMGIFKYSVTDFIQILGRLQRKKIGASNRIIVIIYIDQHPIFEHKIKKFMRLCKNLYQSFKPLK